MRASKRRRYPREECFIGVNFAYDDKAYTEFIRNISERGFYIESNEQIASGYAIMLTYQPPQQGPAKHIGKVVWSDSTAMGIRLAEGGKY